MNKIKKTRVAKGTYTICCVDGCNRPYYGKGFCKLHYMRFRRNGTASCIRAPSGSGHTDKRGYTYHEKNGKPKYLHRIIVENILGCQLTQSAVVHHIDGNRLNNKINNLKVFPNQKEHARLHYREKLLGEERRNKLGRFERCEMLARKEEKDE